VKGTVVILGCAHAGVNNTLRQARRIAGEEKIHAIVGGMHLGSATAEKVDAVVNVLKSAGTNLVGPCHCTGVEAMASIKRALPDAYRQIATGETLVIV
jgi:7,8-dihydropterin-6-yl-methyl-4-(beta-D-ribofuranosyl)aminobenzene 5'-phosphate synthase